MMPPHRSPRAFTMVELLVVIAVLGVLASILLPALARSRDAARTAMCTGQLRQLGLATQMYWDDSEGFAFRFRGPSTNGGDVYWFGWLERGAEGQRRFDPTLGALWRYLPEARVQICPALPDRGPRFKPKATTSAGGYGYNLSFSAPAEAAPVKVASVTRPAEVVVFGDSAQVNTFQAPASPTHPLVEPFFYLSTNEPTAHFRHGGMAAVVFMDGHIARQLPETGTLDGRMPEARIGRLPSRLLLLNAP